VIGIDNQGHGRSTGYRGHVNQFDDYVHDLLYVIQDEIEKHPESKDIPVYLFGHSMGSLICIRTLLLLRNPSLLELVSIFLSINLILDLFLMTFDDDDIMMMTVMMMMM
jgi:alpha-beta hydrolase superfamily lysophospholipase